MTDADRPDPDAPRDVAAEPEIVTPDAMAARRPDALASDGSDVAPGAMRDLARAFQSNADALRGMHEIQGELAAALRRNDRSEMVLQSTNALNDTFRNLASIQRELLQRLGEAQKPRNERLVPALILGLLIVMLGGIYVIVVAIQEQRPLPNDSVNVAALEAGRLKSYQEGMSKGAAESQGRVSRMQLALSDAEDRLRTEQKKYDEAQAELAELAKRKRVAEMERDEMADFAQRARNNAIGKDVAEKALREVNLKMEVAETKLKDREEALMRERQENAMLRKRLAAYNLGLPDDVPAAKIPAAVPPDPKPLDEPAVKSSEANPSAVPPPATPDTNATPPPPALPDAEKPVIQVPPDPDLNRDKRLVGRVRTRLNELLRAGRSTVGEWWQITRIEGIKQDRVGGVVILQYDNAGRFLGSVEARELRIWVDRETQQVEFHTFEGNRLAPGGKKTPISRNGYRFAVAKGKNYASAWRNSGLSMVKTR